MVAAGAETDCHKKYFESIHVRLGGGRQTDREIDR